MCVWVAACLNNDNYKLSVAGLSWRRDAAAAKIKDEGYISERRDKGVTLQTCQQIGVRRERRTLKGEVLKREVYSGERCSENKVRSKDTGKVSTVPSVAGYHRVYGPAVLARSPSLESRMVTVPKCSPLSTPPLPESSVSSAFTHMGSRLYNWSDINNTYASWRSPQVYMVTFMQCCETPINHKRSCQFLETRV